MNICPTCHGKYKKAGTLKSHIRSHRNPDFKPNPKEVATAEELVAAGLGLRPVEGSVAKERDMAGADPVTQDQLRIRDLETQLTGLTEQLATANSHQRLGNVIAHAGEACTDCRQDLDQHNQRIIKAALEGLDPAAARELALAKGVIPRTLTFQV